MTTVTSPWAGLGQPLFEMCWVYMAIAQIAQDPLPLCQTDKCGKKVSQTILGSLYSPPLTGNAHMGQFLQGGKNGRLTSFLAVQDSSIGDVVSQ